MRSHILIKSTYFRNCYSLNNSRYEKDFSKSLRIFNFTSLRLAGSISVNGNHLPLIRTLITLKRFLLHIPNVAATKPRATPPSTPIIPIWKNSFIRLPPTINYYRYRILELLQVILQPHR